VDALYKKKEWQKKVLLNIARIGKFSQTAPSGSMPGRSGKSLQSNWISSKFFFLAEVIKIPL
jgi:hypothetical protein